MPGARLFGTALLLDPTARGSAPTFEVERGVEYLSIPLPLMIPLLKTPARPFSLEGETMSNREGQKARTGGERQEESAEDERQDGDAQADEPVDSGSSPVDGEVLVKADVEEVFEGFIGNEGAVHRLKQYIIYAKLEQHKALKPIGLFGTKSTGKTELARRIARALAIPIVALSETRLTSGNDLAAWIRKTAEEAAIRFEHIAGPFGSTIDVAPAMVVFIDEVHLLRRRVQDSLLTALEPDDRLLRHSSGTMSTENLTFVLATTDSGRLRDALTSRIVRIDLAEYSLAEVVAILKTHVGGDDYPSEIRKLDDDDLKVIARMGRQVPRQALIHLREAGQAIRLRDAKATAKDLQEYFYRVYKVDNNGLTERDRRYLSLLYPDNIKGLDSLTAEMGEGDTSNLEQDIEPFLLKLGLIRRERSGRCLTTKGFETVAEFREKWPEQ